MSDIDDALAAVHNGVSQIDLERIVKATGGSWERIRRTGEYRVRYACMDRPSGPANGRRKDVNRAVVGYVRTALKTMAGRSIVVLAGDAPTAESDAATVDPWTARVVDADHEEALAINAQWVPRDERERRELEKMALEERRAYHRARQREYYQRHKDDPVFKAKCRERNAKNAAWRRAYQKQKRLERFAADPEGERERENRKSREYYRKNKSNPEFIKKYRESWRKSRAKKLAEDPDYDKRKGKEYREKLDREDPGMRKLMSQVHNKKCKDKKKLDPEWREKKNRINRESWARKKAEAMAADPEKFRAEHARKVREWKQKKRAEKRAESSVGAEAK